jgi:hypothetical protein
VLHEDRHHHAGAGLHLGQVEVDSVSGRRRPAQGGEHAERAVVAGDVVEVVAVGVTPRRAQADVVADVRRVRGVAGPRPGAAVARDRQHRQLRVDRLEVGEAAPEAVEHVGTEVLDHHIGARRQSAQDVRPTRTAELDGRAADAASEPAVQRGRRHPRRLEDVGVIREVGVAQRLGADA